MRQLDAERLPLEMRETPEDLGFKVFKLAPSTFRHWEPPAGADPAALEQQLAVCEAGLEPGADPLDVIYEVILKEGYSLNARIEPLGLETNQVYRVTNEAGDERGFYICLDDEIDAGTVESLALDKESVFVCLDTALDDSTKHNLAERCLLKVI